MSKRFKRPSNTPLLLRDLWPMQDKSMNTLRWRGMEKLQLVLYVLHIEVVNSAFKVKPSCDRDVGVPNKQQLVPWVRKY